MTQNTQSAMDVIFNADVVVCSSTENKPQLPLIIIYRDVRNFRKTVIVENDNKENPEARYFLRLYVNLDPPSSKKTSNEYYRKGVYYFDSLDIAKMQAVEFLVNNKKPDDCFLVK